MKLIYGGIEYPQVLFEEGGYEEILVLIPEPTGDYFLSKITSFGDYELIEEVAEKDVKVVL